MADKYIRHGETYDGDGTTSAAALGSTVTISNASPGVVTWNSHPFVANDAVYFSTTGALPTGLTAGTKYFVRNPATNTFEVSATSGGASINTSSAGSGTHTARGSGAWNSINILEGTTPAFGSLSNGDVVYIRSKDAGGANITRTMAANTSLGKASLTTGQKVRWVLDAGSVWSGIAGTLTYKRTAGGYALTARSGNNVECQAAYSLVVSCEQANANAAQLFIAEPGALTDGVHVRMDLVTNTAAGTQSVTNLASTTSFGVAVHRNMKVTAGVRWYLSLVQGADYTDSVFVNLQIVLPIAYTTYGIFRASSFGQRFVLLGGGISGDGATTGAALFTDFTLSHRGALMYGFEMPKSMSLLVTAPTTAVANIDPSITSIGMDGGLGATFASRAANCDSRNDGFYPKLNATYPDSVATPWSWKVYPWNASRDNPAMPPPIVQVYAEAPGTKTATLELLIADTLEPSCTKDNVYVDLFYVDNASGAQTMVTSRVYGSTAALDTSSAAWSATTYGAINLYKRKIALTTPTSIKQDAAVIIVPRVEAKSANALDIMFFCPAAQLT